MALSPACPSCTQTLSAQNLQPGQDVVCPRCGMKFRVPTETPAPNDGCAGQAEHRGQENRRQEVAGGAAA